MLAVIAGIVAAISAAAMIFGGPYAGTWIIASIATLCAAAIGALAYQHNRSGLLWTVYWPAPELEKVECAVCGGIGVVWLHRKRTRAIPRHNRSRKPGQYVSEPKMANASTCPQCQGLGWRWHLKKATVVTTDAPGNPPEDAA